MSFLFLVLKKFSIVIISLSTSFLKLFLSKLYFKSYLILIKKEDEIKWNVSFTISTNSFQNITKMV